MSRKNRKPRGLIAEDLVSFIKTIPIDYQLMRKENDFSLHQLLILGFMRQYCNDRGIITFSVQELMKILLLDKGRIYKGLANLERKGIIEIGNTNRFGREKWEKIEEEVIRYQVKVRG